MSESILISVIFDINQVHPKISHQIYILTVFLVNLGVQIRLKLLTPMCYLKWAHCRKSYFALFPIFGKKPKQLFNRMKNSIKAHNNK